MKEVGDSTRAKAAQATWNVPIRLRKKETSYKVVLRKCCVTLDEGRMRKDEGQVFFFLTEMTA